MSQIFLLARDWSIYKRQVTEYAPAKRGKILVAFHNFLKIPSVAKKYLKDNETQ